MANASKIIRSIIMSKLADFRVAVLATDGFEESELTGPVKALEAAGARVTIVSLAAGGIQGVRHDLDKTVKVVVDRTIRDVSARRRSMRFISPPAPSTPLRCGPA